MILCSVDGIFQWQISWTMTPSSQACLKFNQSHMILHWVKKEHHYLSNEIRTEISFMTEISFIIWQLWCTCLDPAVCLFHIRYSLFSNAGFNCSFCWKAANFKRYRGFRLCQCEPPGVFKPFWKCYTPPLYCKCWRDKFYKDVLIA